MKRALSKKRQSEKKRQYGDGSDVFYTKEQVISSAIARIKQICADNTLDIKSAIDFSAGNGAFIQCMRQSFDLEAAEQYDIAPLCPAVSKKDWLDVSPHPIDFVGFNPPFGFQCKLARKFLAHAAEFEPKLICCLHLFMRKSIFPVEYRVVYEEELAPDSFYNPTTRTTLLVPGCKISYLLKGKLPAVVSSSSTSAPPGYTKVKRERAWDLFTQGLAVRRTGVNAGRQVFVWFGKDNGGAVLIDQRGNYTSLPYIQQTNGQSLSPQPFATYESSSPPTLELGKRLWSIMHERLASRQQAIVPTLDVPFITAALVDALKDVNN
jgi:hypothetical protein